MTDRVEQIISDEAVAKVHGYANFGPMTPREVIAEGVLKYAYGYTAGYTQLTILLEHKLVHKPKPGSYRSTLTERGRAYLRAAWPYHKAAASADLAALDVAPAPDVAALVETVRTQAGLLIAGTASHERAKIVGDRLLAALAAWEEKGNE